MLKNKLKCANLIKEKSRSKLNVVAKCRFKEVWKEVLRIRERGGGGSQKEDRRVRAAKEEDDIMKPFPVVDKILSI